MFAPVGAHLVHVIRLGCGPRTVVGIPGSFGTTDIWEQPFELLSTHHRTITFDHFGTGATYVPDELVSFEAQIGLVTDLLDELGVDRCVLAGDSSMGTVAIEAVRRHPERFEALVLVATGISYAPDEGVRRFVSGLRNAPEPTLAALQGDEPLHQVAITTCRSSSPTAWLPLSRPLIGATTG